MKGMSLRDRFEEKVVKGGSCWEWRGSRSASGYGRIFVRRSNRRAHRVAWELAYGSIPSGALVCHRCDNRCCVRPDHLFLATNDENMADMARKGRTRNFSAKGEAHPMAKLAKSDIEQIHRLRERGLTQAQIASLFSVSRSHIGRVLTGRARN